MRHRTSWIAAARNFSVSFTTVTNNTNCPLMVTRTWWVIDTCGNSNFCQQTVTVSNTPVINCSPNKTISCTNVLLFDPPTVTNACCTNILISTYGSDVVTNFSPCSYATTRTWLITDCCGNSNFCQQTINVTSTPPVINCNPDKTILCTSALIFNPPTVIGDCCTNIFINIFGADVVTNLGPCAHSVTRTWLIADCCYSNFCHQTIIVTSAPPVINCSPAGKPSPAPAARVFDPPTVTNTCCTNLIINLFGSDVTNHLGPCSYSVTRTWLVTDCCGFSNLLLQIVTVVDTNCASAAPMPDQHRGLIVHHHTGVL